MFEGLKDRLTKFIASEIEKSLKKNQALLDKIQIDIENKNRISVQQASAFAIEHIEQRLLNTKEETLRRIQLGIQQNGAFAVDLVEQQHISIRREIARQAQLMLEQAAAFTADNIEQKTDGLKSYIDLTVEQAKDLSVRSDIISNAASTIPALSKIILQLQSETSQLATTTQLNQEDFHAKIEGNFEETSQKIISLESSIQHIENNIPDLESSLKILSARLDSFLDVTRSSEKSSDDSTVICKSEHLLENTATQQLSLHKIESLLSNLQASNDAIIRDVVRVGQWVHETRERAEFIRREIMYEMRYDMRKSQLSHDIDQSAQIMNAERVASFASASNLRLNLGCGHIALSDYINVDGRDIPGIDIKANVADLPFNKGEVSEIYSAHLLEHFPEEQMRRQLLPYWFELLKPGGSFRAITPDATAMMAAYAEGDMTYEALREVMFGAQDYVGDFHFNMFSAKHLSSLLEETGFCKIEIIAEGRQNGLCREFEIRAVRP